MKLFLVLGFVFVEIQSSRWAAHQIGWGSLLFYFLLAFMAGGNVLRRATQPLAPGVTGGGVSEEMLARALTGAVAGVLLMLPGVFSDVLAILCLLPPGRFWLERRLRKSVAGRTGPWGWSMAFGGMGEGQPFRSDGDGDVIDGEAREVHEESPRLTGPEAGKRE